MTTEQQTEITRYLSGPRDWFEGVALYQKYGVNLRLKRQFAVDDTSVTREILFDELRKLAGLSEVQFANLPRLSASIKKEVIIENKKTEQHPDNESELLNLADSFGVTVDELVSPDFQERVLAMENNEERIDELTGELEKARSKYAETPEPVRKMIRFRENFPFLNSPDCPDILKVLVADMFTAYGNYKAAHARLQTLGDTDAATAAADCENVVTEYLRNREIWEELEHYRTTGTILGKAAKFREQESAEDLAALSDVDLIGQLRSAQANESKHKRVLADAQAKGEDNEKAAAAFEKWSARKQLLQAELAKRKKK